MGIVIFRSIGEEPLEKERMQDINLAEKEEIRRVINRACNREAAESAVMRSDSGIGKAVVSSLRDSTGRREQKVSEIEDSGYYGSDV